jgi:hypothetical protein
MADSKFTGFAPGMARPPSMAASPDAPEGFSPPPTPLHAPSRRARWAVPDRRGTR